MRDHRPIAYRLTPLYPEEFSPGPRGQERMFSAAVIQCIATGEILAGMGGGGEFLAPGVVETLRGGGCTITKDDPAAGASPGEPACPFCGNTKITVNTKAKGYFDKKQAERERRDTSNYLCRCTKCGAKGPLKHTREEALHGWRTRA